jgi:predicted RND superfamily exporter protein
MRVGFAADVATRVEELEGLQADLTVSGFIVLALVIGLIVWYFRAWQALLILGIPLLLGAVSAFGLVALPPFNIRHLNSNTAFLGTIIIGNGINSGIILLARFQEERRNSSELQDALTVAMKQTWRPTLAAALAASAAYGSLVFTDFRGFNQFGWIGGLGMLLCWGSTMLLAPPLIMTLGKRMAKPPRGSQRPSSDKPGFVPRIFLSRPRIVLGVTLLATLLAVVGVGRRTSDWIEYDLSKLRRRDSWTGGERYWGARMDQTLGRYLTPSVVMTNNAQQTRNLKQRFERLAEEGKAGNLIDRVQTAASLLPETRFEAVREVKRIAEALTPRLRSHLDSNDRELVERAISDASARPLTTEQLPAALVAGLREKNGRIDRSVLIYPKLGGGTWDAERIQAFADDVRREAEKESKDIKAAGTVLLSSDIAQALRHDGPRATGLSLLAVLCICLIAFRARRNPNPSDALARRHGLLAAAAILSLLLGVLLMLGGLAWTGARLNFSNFVALPITFGIAADYSINMLKRYQAEGKLELSRVFQGTGSAVALCSLTTIIGFGSLLLAQNQALFSFGVLAIVGEFTCLFTAVVVLPALFLVWEQAKQRRKAGAEGSLE